MADLDVVRSFRLPEVEFVRPALWRHLWQIWSRKKIGLACLAIVALLIAVAAAAPFLVTHDPLRNDLSAGLVGPSREHWFGTDLNGRDIYSRIIYGARVSIFVGFSAVTLGVSTGSLVGLLSGFVGGTLDYIIQRIVDAIMAIPGLVLLMMLVSVLEPSVKTLTLVLSFLVLPSTIRVVRGEVLVVREVDYVSAAQALGASPARIMFSHVLRNVGAPILIIASVMLGQTIMAETSLSFLGLGVPPPEATWGQMLAGDARQYMVRAPWLLIFPALAITIAILAFNMVGDAMRDLLDPRLRGSR